MGEIAQRVHAYFSEREAPVFFAGVRDGRSAEEMRSPRWQREREVLAAAADAVVAGQFALLGHGTLSFGMPIDWHLDPVSQKRAPRIHWSRIPYLDAELIGDHKVIWEVNRHQHFVTLGRAFQVTRDAKYAECFVEHLTSWMDANPPKQGVNWASSLEVGYRAIAWLWAIELFRGAAALTPAVLARTLKYLYIHGRHLEQFLSTYFSPNTHLTGEALALLYLGVLLPEVKRARQWRRLGWRILDEQLPRQVLADGVYFEQASYYHRYTVDIYLHAMMLGESNGLAVPARMRKRLTLAAEHLADLTRPDGTIPIIGDDDGGSLLQLETRAFADVRSTLAIAAVVLNRPELAAVAGRPGEEVLWMLGPDGLAQADSFRAFEPPAHTSKLFDRGGYAIMRDGWGRDALHAVVDCGPFGNANGGHAHSDVLSIEVAARGCAILVDPGTYTYTSSVADRNHFRHSAAHNTVTVDGESAAVPSGPFSWVRKTDARLEAWWSGGLVDRTVASHPGFLRLPSPATHRRSVLFVRGDYWVVCDTVLSDGDHEVTAHWHAALGARVRPAGPGRSMIEVPCGEGVTGLLLAAVGDVTDVEWGEDWVSPSYGSRERAPYARVTSRGTGRRDLITVLCPSATGDGVAVREVPANQGRAVVVDRHGGQDLLLFRTEGILRLDDVEMDADAAWIRRSADGAVAAMALFGGDGSSLGVGNVRFSASGAAEASRRGSEWEVEGAGRVTLRD